MKKVKCQQCGRETTHKNAKKERWYIAEETLCFECIKAETLEQLEAERELLNDEYKRYHSNFNYGVC